MTRNELTTKLDEIIKETNELEQSKNEAYAELGKKMFPYIAEGEHSEITAKIRSADDRISILQIEKITTEAEYDRLMLAAKCFYCGAENSDDAAFCEECGKKLGKPREYCDACGTINGPTQKFCGECGAKLDEIVIAII